MAERARLRFAPSPTGYAHIGTARTALYNFLLARHLGGDFILRIEDTDRRRYMEESVADIVTSLHALGIDWDEGPDKGGAYGPYRQSERLPIYHEYLHRLIETGHAYPCFCSGEKTAASQHKGDKKGSDSASGSGSAASGSGSGSAPTPVATGYDRTCRSIPPEEARRRMEKEPYAIRFKMPLSGTTVAHDALRGDITFDNSLLDDHVLLKQKQPGEKWAWPTYHGAAPIDDHLMKITHIVRGDEWLPSIPRHVLLFKAFGWEPPVFCHLPVILSPSGKGKMAKREGSTAVREFLKAGYLPEALRNFILLLGWSGKNDQDIYSLEEAIAAFTMEGISKSPAAFRTDKLDWLNGVYIRNLSTEELAERLAPYMQEAGLLKDPADAGERDYLKQIVPLIQERITLLSDTPELVRFLYEEPPEYEAALLMQKVSAEEASRILQTALEVVAAAEPFTGEHLHAVLKEAAERLGVKAGQMFLPLRVAVSGRPVSPGSVTDIMAILGRDKTRARLAKALGKLGKL